MYVSHISISSDYDDESIDSYVSNVILNDSEAKDTASPAALAPSSPDYVLTSPDYILVSNTKTKPFKAPASPDYTPDSDTDTKPFKEDPQEAGP
nr:hypothetical protein [Tanacetum cinerariifolium]